MENYIGRKNEVTIVVSREQTAASVKSGSLPVLATPVMIALMEQAASEICNSIISDDETSVGIEISVSHLAPTVMGAEVSAVATLTEIDKRKFVFSVEAFDGGGKIGEGRHSRFIVNKEKFMKKADERAFKQGASE